MTVTASSGSTRVAPQRYDTLPLSSVRQAEQQDRFPDGGELDALTTFFRSGQIRVEAARRISANADAIVARAANRIFTGGTPLSYLDAPLSTPAVGAEETTALAADQAAFQRSVRTFAQGSGGTGLLGRILEGVQADADVRVVLAQWIQSHFGVHLRQRPHAQVAAGHGLVPALRGLRRDRR